LAVAESCSSDDSIFVVAANAAARERDTATAFGKNAVNGAGEVGANSSHLFCVIELGRKYRHSYLHTEGGAYTFTFQHEDGMFFAFDSQRSNLGTVIGGALQADGIEKWFTTQTLTPQAGFGTPGGSDISGI
jgi:hypothetical protein